eukprot:9504063-Pyramimonas_sp.AAC.1
MSRSLEAPSPSIPQLPQHRGALLITNLNLVEPNHYKGALSTPDVENETTLLLEFTLPMEAASQSVVWVAGSAGTFASTADGGVTWRLPPAPLSIHDLHAPVVTPAGDVGWVAGDF